MSKRLELKSPFFNGVSFQVYGAPDGMELSDAILELSNIKGTWPVQHHTLPEHDVNWTGSEPSHSPPSGSKRDLEEGYPPHVMTQIDRLKADGITGSGIKIAIIDTGVNTCPRRCIAHY